ncbi:hypothetical protein A2U01_0112121, partial [Trifolium medium]|nr:hypothetical protein [Trifolium medium]
ALHQFPHHLPHE